MVASIGLIELFILLAIVIGVYAGVIWMIIEILRRDDFSDGMKAVWVFLAIFFSLITLLVYLLFVRKKDYSTG